MNYYQTDNQDKETSKYIVSYIDLMGTENRIEYVNNVQIYSMNILHNLYSDFINNILKNTHYGFNDIKIKIFSDNIIMAKKLSKDETISDVNCLLNATAIFHNMSMTNKFPWLSRGGITVGDLYIDDIMVWGKALTRAYYLENKMAKFPRILIDDEITGIIENEKINDIILKDFDDLYFLNSLKCNKSDFTKFYNGFKILKQELKVNYTPRIYENLCWHMNYVNREFSKSKDNNECSNVLSLD